MTRALHWSLTACLTVEWVALGIWVGGLVVLVGAVIPAVFNSFGGQEAGGFFLTRTFEGYNRIVLGAIAALLGGVAFRVWVSLRGVVDVRPSQQEWLVLGGMILVALVIISVLHPEAAALQAQAFATKEGPARKAAFEAFFSVHWPVRILYGVNMCLGVALMTLKASRSLGSRGEKW